MTPPPIVAGGCQLSLVSGTNCQTLNLSPTGNYEFAWSTNTTFCEGPHHVYIFGSPNNNWTTNFGKINVSSGTTSWSGMTRNIGGYVLLTPADLAGLTTDTGKFYWAVTNFSEGSFSGIGTFYLQGTTPVDTTAPTVPSGLTATPVGPTQINLAWTASTDSVGVTAYKVSRGGSLIATLGNVTSYSDTGLTASTAYSYTVSACDAAANCSAQSAAASATTPAVTAPSSRLVNISTRGQVQTGDNIMIGGFIIGGSEAKKVVIRGRGPSMAALGVQGTLADPAIRLFNGATPTDFNDNWQSATNAAAITASGQAPTDAKEAAILTTVNPGVPYTVHLSGVSDTSGIAIVEVFELDKPEAPLLNISTRGPVLTGDQVMIGGFIIQGDASQQVLVVAKGPSLGAAPFNVPGALADPTLELYAAGNPLPIETNDNWVNSTNMAAIQASGNAPTNPLESAIIRTLAPGAYTAIVKGVGAFQGIGLVEVYKK